MSTWIKRILVAAVIVIPASGYAVAKYRAAHACPITPDCPCAKK